MPSDSTGFQPRNTPAERRAFFDLERQLQDVLGRLATLDAEVAVLESRVDLLEEP